MTPKQSSDAAVQALREALVNEAGEVVTLQRVDALWLLGEIDGGREAFAEVVAQKRELEPELADLRRNHERLLATWRAGKTAVR